jgi:alanine dehydrogenase
MLIGVPKEIKDNEYRVGLTPESVFELINQGCKVFVETKAGDGIGANDLSYEKAGAVILSSAFDVFKASNLIIKVKEPQPQECALLTKDHVLFTFLHLAPDIEQARALLKSGCVAIAYETVTDSKGHLPILIPMSAIAGRMSVQVAAHHLEKPRGSGKLLSGLNGIEPAKVVILGGGVVGCNAARMALGLGADVTIVDMNSTRLFDLDFHFSGRLKTVQSTKYAIENLLQNADIVIGAVLLAGEEAPKLVTADMINNMKESIVIDVAIDQGGCFETSRPTTHSDPTYKVGEVIHYCVTNMPGAVSNTATRALNHVTLPFILELAKKGYKKAITDNCYLRSGLNIENGKIIHPAVAKALEDLM